MFRAAGEAVFVRDIIKPSGGTRTVCDFGLRSRAIQYLLKPFLEVCGAAKDHQYGFCGRSRDDLALYVKAQVERGYPFAVILDIANCFGSFNGDAVANHLPLPCRVADNHVTVRQQRLRRRSRHSRSRNNSAPRGIVVLSGANPSPGALRPMVLGGIPQGSAVSNLVAASLLADLIDVVPEGTPFGQYGDDIIALAKTEFEACTIRDALRSALEGHPSGSMGLKRSQVSSIADGFDYLGYHFFGSVEDTEIFPTMTNVQGFRRRWVEAVRTDYLAGRYRGHEARKVARDFVSGFRASTGIAGLTAAVNFKADHTLFSCQAVGRMPSSRLNPLSPVPAF